MSTHLVIMRKRDWIYKIAIDVNYYYCVKHTQRLLNIITA